jgi:hypothetical protein
MDIVLDSNVSRRDPLLRSAEFDVLVDFAVSTDSRIRIPTIVFEEVIANYERELFSRLAEYKRAVKSLNGYVYDFEWIDSGIDIKVEVDRYKTRLLEKLRIGSRDLVTLKDSYFQDVINRAIHRRRPCTDRGEEIRDAIIWLAVLDVGQDSYDGAVSFISGNTKQFAEAGTLHAQLVSEANDRNVVVHYYPTLTEFVAKQTSQSETYTREWFAKQLDVRSVLDAADLSIHADAGWSLGVAFCDELSEREKASSTGYFNRITDTIPLDKYLVHAMADGSLRGLAIYRGEIEVECEYQYEIEVEEEEPAPLPDQPHRTFTRRRYEWESDYMSVSPEVEIYVGFTIIDGKLDSWVVQNV